MKLIPALIVLIILLVSILSQAQADVSVELHGVSWHIGTDKEYNERNLGAGVVYSWGVVGVSAGAYHNSERRLSVYGAATFRASVSRYVSLGVDLGAVTGYQPPVAPVITPVLRAHITKRAAVNMRYLPAIGGVTPAVASLSVEISLF